MSGRRDQRDWTDRQLLDILDRHERQGQTSTVIAERYGVGRGAIAGPISRIRVQVDRVPDLATRPENGDGGMPARWWAQ